MSMLLVEDATSFCNSCLLLSLLNVDSETYISSSMSMKMKLIGKEYRSFEMFRGPIRRDRSIFSSSRKEGSFDPTDVSSKYCIETFNVNLLSDRYLARGTVEVRPDSVHDGLHDPQIDRPFKIVELFSRLLSPSLDEDDGMLGVVTAM